MKKLTRDAQRPPRATSALRDYIDLLIQVFFWKIFQGMPNELQYAGRVLSPTIPDHPGSC